MTLEEEKAESLNVFRGVLWGAAFSAPVWVAIIASLVFLIDKIF